MIVRLVIPTVLVRVLQKNRTKKTWVCSKKEVYYKELKLSPNRQCRLSICKRANGTVIIRSVDSEPEELIIQMKSEE